ncbi:hypothetical protein ACQ4M4_22470 [Leptolyngbya sp. AN02str]|uniref:hypothetical protein n=1 Tax=Leptolyngbya sp. AN02str TaxID=3423363 RepID=UPI003D3230AC
MSSVLSIRLTMLGAIGGLFISAPAAIAAGTMVSTVGPSAVTAEVSSGLGSASSDAVQVAQEWGNEDWERRRVEEREQQWERENGRGDDDTSDPRDAREEWFRENRSERDRDRRPSSHPSRNRIIYRDTHPNSRRNNTWENDWNYRYNDRDEYRSRSSNCYVAFQTHSGIRNSRDAESIAREFIGCEVGIHPYSNIIRISNISQIHDWGDRTWVIRGVLDRDSFSVRINSSNAQIVHYERSPVTSNRINIWPF